VLRGLRRRLDRLWVVYQREKAYRDSVRAGQDANEKFVKALRAGLTRAGIDPATVPAMRRCDEPDPPAPREPYRPPGPAARLREKLLRIVRDHREHPLDINTASPMELFAVYCFIPDAPGVSYLRPEIA
jgi:hypothetical protein